MAGFKLELASMRRKLHRAEIDAMLDKFEQIYAPHEDAEDKLVMAVFR